MPWASVHACDRARLACGGPFHQLLLPHRADCGVRTHRARPLHLLARIHPGACRPAAGRGCAVLLCCDADRLARLARALGPLAPQGAVAATATLCCRGAATATLCCCGRRHGHPLLLRRRHGHSLLLQHSATVAALQWRPDPFDVCPEGSRRAPARSAMCHQQELQSTPARGVPPDLCSCRCSWPSRSRRCPSRRCRSKQAILPCKSPWLRAPARGATPSTSTGMWTCATGYCFRCAFLFAPSHALAAHSA
jgi:hypothetical protein